MKRVECHLFSGMLGVGAEDGTKELERLIDELPSLADSHHHKEGQWEKVLADIVERHKAHDTAIIILIGHSYGAKRCVQIANGLAVENIDVAYVAGIDPTALFFWQSKMDISLNIGLVDEFHATKGVCHKARMHDPNGGSGGMYVVPGAMSDVHEIFKVPGKHIKCPASKITRKRILETVEKLIS